MPSKAILPLAFLAAQKYEGSIDVQMPDERLSIIRCAGIAFSAAKMYKGPIKERVGYAKAAFLSARAYRGSIEAQIPEECKQIIRYARSKFPLHGARKNHDVKWERKLEQYFNREAELFNLYFTYFNWGI